MSSHDDNQRNPRVEGTLPANPATQQVIEELLARIETSYRTQQEDQWHRDGSWPARPGEGPANQLGSPVNWRELSDEDYATTFGALCTFLEWAIPRWNFTTDQFPYHCWWMHPDVFEEITAWWGLWQGYIRNPNAHIVDALTFHERTDLVKERLTTTYRGRCRHKHEPAPPAPDVVIPDLPSLLLAMQARDTGPGMLQPSSDDP